MAQTNTKTLKDSANHKTSKMSEKEREAKVEQAKQRARNAKPGSLADKANMVNKFNRNN